MKTVLLYCRLCLHPTTAPSCALAVQAAALLAAAITASWAMAFRQAWVARLTEEAQAMIERRFVPSLKRSKQRYQVGLRSVGMGKSANVEYRN